MEGTVGDAKYSSVAYPGVSSYMVVKQGSQPLKLGGVSENIKVDAGKYYTLAVTPAGKVVTLDDAIIEQPNKAYVYFYNFSDAAKASLFAPQHKADIVADVAAGSSKFREVNALTVDMDVKANGEKVDSFPGVELKRRTGTSFVLVGTKGKLQAIKVDNNIQR